MKAPGGGADTPGDWRVEYRLFVRKIAARCGQCGHIPYRSPWRYLRRALRGVRLHGTWYCGSDCLQRAVAGILERASPATAPTPTPSHRIPLGLLLLSRQQVTGAQLRTALDRQRAAGKGKIGEWLQHLGFVTEIQVTGALARQWSCPVLRANLTQFEGRGNGTSTAVPLPLLEASRMIPVEFSEASRTLLMAFSDAVDHSALYAIEQMLGYRTEACFVPASDLRKGLQALQRARGPEDVVFDRMEDVGECARVIGSYSARLAAEDVRLIRCGRHIWVRLERMGREAVNLVLRSPAFSGASVRDGSVRPPESHAKVLFPAADNL